MKIVKNPQYTTSHKAMNKELNIQGLVKWEMKKKFLYASDTKKKKRLYVTIAGDYIVWHNGSVILTTARPMLAIREYNGI